MAVAVNNTAADLVGKTLAKLQDPQTIVGLKTFDLGLAAPFGVGPGAAMVVNLDAEKVGGQTNAQLHDAALLTGALPAVSGANLTDLNATNITTGTLANARLTPIIPPTVILLTDGASVALDASLGNLFYFTAAGDRTIAAVTNGLPGQKIVIAHYADASPRTLALTTGVTGGFRFGSDVTGLTATAAGHVDYIGCILSVDSSRWDVVAYSKGY